MLWTLCLLHFGLAAAELLSHSHCQHDFVIRRCDRDSFLSRLRSRKQSRACILQNSESNTVSSASAAGIGPGGVLHVRSAVAAGATLVTVCDTCNIQMLNDGFGWSMKLNQVAPDSLDQSHRCSSSTVNNLPGGWRNLEHIVVDDESIAHQTQIPFINGTVVLIQLLSAASSAGRVDCDPMKLLHAATRQATNRHQRFSALKRSGMATKSSIARLAFYFMFPCQ